MLHIDALSRNPLSSILLVNESKESLVARIRKVQHDDAKNLSIGQESTI